MLQWSLAKPAEMTHSMASLGLLVLLGFAGLIAGLIAKWILTLRQMALMRIAGGFSTDWQEAYSAVLARKWQVVALWILTAIVSIGLVVGWFMQFYFMVKDTQSPSAVVPGFIISIILFFTALFVVCFSTFMSLCLIACDKLDFKDSIDKTIKLLFGNFGRCLAFCLTFILVISILSYPVSMPIVLVGLWDTYKLGIGSHPSEMPMHTVIIGHVWESILTLLISPLFSYAFAVFYVDLLNRKEGLDLRRRLTALMPSPQPGDNHGT